MYDILSILSYYGMLTHDTEISSDSVKVNCPFHKEAVSSLCVSLRRGLLYCFGCSWHGDIIDMVSKIENIDRIQAMIKMIKVAKSNNIIVYTNQKSYEDLLEGAFIQYDSAPKVNWYNMDDHYLIKKRKFTPKTLERFGVKLEPGSLNYPIMIPIYDNGEFAGVLRRRVDNVEERKYINNKGFRKKRTVGGNYREGKILICEGPLDMMKSVQYGYSNAVCIFGWKISKVQAQKIKQYTDVVIDALDNSPRGREGGDELKRYFNVLRFAYPPGPKDICEMSKHNFRKSIIDIIKGECKHE